MLARLDRHYTIEMNETFNIARFLTVCPHVVACCPGVPDGDLRRLFFTPAPTPAAALESGPRARRAGHRRPWSLRALLPPRPSRPLRRTG